MSICTSETSSTVISSSTVFHTHRLIELIEVDQHIQLLLPALHSAEDGAQVLLKVEENDARQRLWGLLDQLQAEPLLRLSDKKKIKLCHLAALPASNKETEAQKTLLPLTTDSSRKCSRLSRISVILPTERTSESSGTSCFSPSQLNQSLI